MTGQLTATRTRILGSDAWQTGTQYYGSVDEQLTYHVRGWLTGKESVRTAASGDIYAPGVSERGTYAYDLNGNLKKDSRRALLFAYNSLNLLSEVRRDGQPAAKYDWLADGFEYVGSLIYRKSGSDGTVSGRSDILWGECWMKL